jgi:sigma-E factor negative regulatory protein RseB
MLLERLFLDQETSLLLRREQFEHGNAPSRTIEFSSIDFDGPPVVPDPPERIVNLSPKRVSADKVPSGVSAPVALADGYERLGLFRRPGGVVQVQYSDGLYDLSVFQQQGRLDRNGLPAASRVTVGNASSWHYAWPGGHVVLWEGDGTVYTAVSDAPLDQVLAAARSVPPARGAASLLSRLRQACRTLIQPLGA